MFASRRIPYRERKFIPRHMYALPERAPGRGSLPLADPRHPNRYDAAHVRNAAARLNMMRHRRSVDVNEYHRASLAIQRGARTTGVQLRSLKLLATVSRMPSRETHETRLAAYARPRRNARTGRFTR